MQQNTAKVSSDFSNHTILIKRVILLVIIGYFCFRWYSHLMPYQLLGAPLAKVEYNILSLSYRFINADNLLNQNLPISIFGSISLLLIPILLLKYTNNKILGWLFVFNNLMYHVYYTTHTAFFYHYWAGVIIISIVFLSTDKISVNFIWKGIRYIICTLYVSAFFWKFANGAIFQFDFGESVFKRNLSNFLYLYPESFMTAVYQFFLSNPILLNLGTYACFLMEGAFLIAYFTTKYDKLLILNILLLHHFLYLFIDTLFIEWYILALPFLSVKFWNTLQLKLNKSKPQLSPSHP